jgi:Kef-type K+ transport system membrane component KefB
MPKAKTLGYGFLIPLFFAYTGANVDLSTIGAGWLLLIALLVAGIAGKVIGSYAGSRLSGYDDSESKKIGWGMIPRAEYTLVIGQIALVAGAISVGIHSVLVLFVITTMIMTPILLRWVYERV